MAASLRSKHIVVPLGLAAIYFAAAKLGLRLAFLHPSATPVWPPSGIALSAFLLLGDWVWPGIFAGAFLANLTTAGTVATSLGIAAGNTLEGLIGAYLVRRFAGGGRAFEGSMYIARFLLLAAGFSTTVSATIGVTSLSLGGFAPWQEYGPIWLTWWLGDAVGDLLFAPAIILWATRPKRTGRVWEAAGVGLGLAGFGWLAFGAGSPLGARHYPLEFLCIPFLLWAALRLGLRDAATAILVLTGLAVWGTLGGGGPFVRGSANESLLLLHAFLGATAVMTLIVAAVVAERMEAVTLLRQLAVRDPLTGLANYREFVRVLEGEIERSGRTARAFAVVLLDLDGLKKINDRYGHIVGSGALLRVADVLRASSRAVDTAARFGGDEFALVLPETEGPAAFQVAERVRSDVAADPAPPRLSVSVGVALYPIDGTAPEDLLRVADQSLYEAKRGAATSRDG